MDKNVVYNNILKMINGGYFYAKYKDLTKNIDSSDLENRDIVNKLEEISANIFNAIVIGCQLFDDEERIIKFSDMFSNYIDVFSLEMFLENFNISEKEALERLKHGFALHFTTPKICEQIKEKGYISKYGNNAMFTKEEDKIITDAAEEQKRNNQEAEEKLNYLFRGWGTGVSSYSSITNGFWMYHTPESLSFLYGNISRRDKEHSMEYIASNVSSVSDDNRRIAIDTMDKIYDRLIGDDLEVACVLIDRDAFEYEIDYYYSSGNPVPVERRPYSRSFNDIMNNDNKITSDIGISNLRFVKIPTIYELEKRKLEENNKKHLHNV